MSRRNVILFLDGIIVTILLELLGAGLYFTLQPYPKRDAASFQEGLKQGYQRGLVHGQHLAIDKGELP